jgi:hypothetical protein
LYVWAARNPYLNIDYEPIVIKRASKRYNLNASLSSTAQLVTGKMPPTAYLERLKSVTNFIQTISDFGKGPIPRVHEVQIMMKAQV